MEANSTKHRILETAIELFSQKGYGETSLREIAKAVGIKASSIYKHYPSKEALIMEMFELLKAMYERDWPKESISLSDSTEAAVDRIKKRIVFLFTKKNNDIYTKLLKIITYEQARYPIFSQFIKNELIENSYKLLKHELVGLTEKGSIQKKDLPLLAAEIYSIVLSYSLLDILEASPIANEIKENIAIESMLNRILNRTNDGL